MEEHVRSWKITEASRTCGLEDDAGDAILAHQLLALEASGGSVGDEKGLLRGEIGRLHT